MGEYALRYMYDLARGNDYNYWPTRYTGSSDSGGVACTGIPASPTSVSNG